MIGGGFVEVTESRIIEAGAVEQVGPRFRQQGQQAGMNDFGRLFANDVNTKVAVKRQKSQAPVPGEAPARPSYARRD